MEMKAERKEFFANYKAYCEKIKKMVKSVCKDAEVFVFGSVLKGDYSVGLSDIDVAIVSETFKNRKEKLKVLDILLEEFFFSPFEFHVLTKKEWEFYKRFIDKMEKV